MSENHPTESQPNAAVTLWREPMLWLVCGIPLFTLFAGFWTLKLAAGRSATDAAPEPVTRTAQIQTSDVQADIHAAQRGISAQLVRAVNGQIVLTSQSITETELILELIHPLAAQFDQRVRLIQQQPGEWRGEFRPKVTAQWHLRLSATNGSWRLTGRETEISQSIALQPAIAKP